MLTKGAIPVFKILVLKNFNIEKTFTYAKVCSDVQIFIVKISQTIISIDYSE